MRNVYEIIARYCDPGSPAYRVLITHSVLVTRDALKLARKRRKRRPEEPIDLVLLEEMAMLHDLGIVRTHAPEIGCHGEDPYLFHGVRGREILEAEGLPRHALGCERHSGAGISREEARALGLPEGRDYLPVSLEEKILCVADKFWGKRPDRLWKRRSKGKVRRKMAEYGPASAERWEELWREVRGR